MPTDSGQTTSFWMQTAAIQTFSALQQDSHADVCVIGAGITGLTTAYLLLQQGRSVIVLDDGPIGGGATGRTTAHLSNALDERYYEIERLHGAAGAQVAAASHSAAIDQIEAIVATGGIDCQFERLNGYLFLAPDGSTEELERELAAAQRAGLSTVSLMARAPLAFFDTGPCLQFPRQGQFHPLRYLAGLAGAIHARGGLIYTGTHATEVVGGSPARVTATSGATVTAEAVVVATNTPVIDRYVMHTKQAPYRTYIIGMRVPPISRFGGLSGTSGARPYISILNSIRGRIPD